MSTSGAASRSLYQDWARVLAAQTVLVGHLRNEFLPALHAVPDPAAWLQLVAVWGGFGTVAVTVFFAISGLQVGAAIMQSGKGFADYAIDRIARFLCVLLPLVICCRLLYEAGLLDVPAYAVDLRSALVNLASLQTLIGPQYAGDYPLWSLANEWCYYFLLPALWLGLRDRRPLLLLFAGALLVFYAGHAKQDYLLGAAVWLAASLRLGQRQFASAPRALMALLCALVFMCLERVFRQAWLLLPVGLFFLFSCHGWTGRAGGHGFGRTFIRWQKHTFSLYVVHVPCIFALRKLGVTLDAETGWPGFIGLFLLINVIAGVFYWLFERHYLSLRRTLKSALRVPALS